MTHERIQTTLSKPRSCGPCRALITARQERRRRGAPRVYRVDPDRTTVKRVFETIAPRFVDRPGGYTRILRLGARRATPRRPPSWSSWTSSSRPGEGPAQGVDGRPRAPRPGRPRGDGAQEESRRARKRRNQAETKKQAKPRKPPRAQGPRGAGRPRRGRQGPSRTGHTKRGDKPSLLSSRANARDLLAGATPTMTTTERPPPRETRGVFSGPAPDHPSRLAQAPGDPGRPRRSPTSTR
jgi:large subunit ribosomal protein L17